MKPILLVGASASEGSLGAIRASLDELGHPWVHKCADDPLELLLEGTCARWRWNDVPDTVVDLRNPERSASPFGAVFVRSLHVQPRYPAASTHWNAETVGRENFWNGEIVSLVMAYLLHLEQCGVPVINPVASTIRANNKTIQLFELAAAGANVPTTLSTRDPVAARELAKTGESIYKAVGSSAPVRRIVPSDLEEPRISSLARAPVTFQPMVGDSDLRVYMCEGDVLASLLVRSSKTVDSRQQFDTVEEAPISPALITQLGTAMKNIGLRYAAIDIRVTRADGPPYTGHILEMNGSPMFSTYARSSGVPIAARIAGKLAELAR